MTPRAVTPRTVSPRTVTPQTVTPPVSSGWRTTVEAGAVPSWTVRRADDPGGGRPIARVLPEPGGETQISGVAIFEPERSLAKPDQAGMPDYHRPWRYLR